MGMTIFVNGKEHFVTNTEMSYEKICELAGKPDYASVMYLGPRHGDSERSGCLRKGQSVVLESRMIFEAMVTGNA